MQTTLPIHHPSTRGGILVLTLFCTAACSDPEPGPHIPVNHEALAQPSKADPPRPPKIAVPMDELHLHDPAELFIEARPHLYLKPKPLAQPPKFRCPRMPPALKKSNVQPEKKLHQASVRQRPCGRST